ncbi:MAG: monovalent cation/H+ antiporter subunit D [Sandarakinorhabdus sp.]|nr:monovalent cation/H+ antiporter subunit D [Sandarakinorhabdus sp.]
MSHLPILPILIPLVAAALMLLWGQRGLPYHRAFGLGAMALGAMASVALAVEAGTDAISVYAVGDWPAPFGIVLVADRLAATMVLLVYALGIPALLMATGGTDRLGRHFHPLFLLQIAGLAGAFLTGDIFNLFVFFEILLLASYAMLVHGGGPERARAGMAYVIINLVGSAMFLVAVALIYGTLGTLTIADIAYVLPNVPPADLALVRAAFAILVGVFLLKAAVLPMAFWLPHVYSAATPAIGALFAIMTKVGIVALLRLSVIGFGPAKATEALLLPWLPVLALATIALGTVGVFAASRLATVAANLVLISSGTLLFAVAFADGPATAALLYYLPHTTMATGGLFLLAGHIAERRGELGDRLVRGPCVGDRMTMGIAYAVLAVGLASLPPLSGFLGKLMLLQGAGDGVWQPLWWGALLLSGLGVTLVLSRSASLIFWQPEKPLPAVPSASGPGLALWLLVLAGPAWTLGAAPAAAWARDAAGQLHAREPYVAAVLGDVPDIQRERRP